MNRGATPNVLLTTITTVLGEDAAIAWDRDEMIVVPCDWWRVVSWQYPDWNDRFGEQRSDGLGSVRPTAAAFLNPSHQRVSGPREYVLVRDATMTPTVRWAYIYSHEELRLAVWQRGGFKSTKHREERMTDGSMAYEDLSLHVRSCTICKARVDRAPPPAAQGSAILTSELCAIGRGFYIAWWEWCRDQPYPAEMIRPSGESPH